MAALVTLLLVLLLFLSSKVVEQYQFHQLLYDGRTGMMLNFDDFKRKQNPNDFIEEVAKDFEVGIAKYSYKDSTHIQVFTTDPTLGGRVRLVEGSYPAARSGEFISTKTTNTTAQVGRFTSGESQIIINLFIFSLLKELYAQGKTVLLVTHDLELARRAPERLAL